MNPLHDTMRPLYLAGERCDEAAHVEWLHDHGRREFDARQFRASLTAAVEAVRPALLSTASALRDGAATIVRMVAAEMKKAAATDGREAVVKCGGGP